MGERIEVKVSHQFTESAEQVFDAGLDPSKVRATTDLGSGTGIYYSYWTRGLANDST